MVATIIREIQDIYIQYNIRNIYIYVHICPGMSIPAFYKSNNEGIVIKQRITQSLVHHKYFYLFVTHMSTVDQQSLTHTTSYSHT